MENHGCLSDTKKMEGIILLHWKTDNLLGLMSNGKINYHYTSKFIMLKQLLNEIKFEFKRILKITKMDTNPRTTNCSILNIFLTKFIICFRNTFSDSYVFWFH